MVLLGSSGVGKSTITNALLGTERQLVRDVREDDSRGRHTTTSRELFELPGGGLLIDTPGMRSLELSDAEDGLDRAFADIETLAAACRFADCAHEMEPGCAVIAAIEAGDLPADRLRARRKLHRELGVVAKAADAAARRANARTWGRDSPARRAMPLPGSERAGDRDPRAIGHRPGAARRGMRRRTLPAGTTSTCAPSVSRPNGVTGCG